MTKPANPRFMLGEEHVTLRQLHLKHGWPLKAIREAFDMLPAPADLLDLKSRVVMIQSRAPRPRPINAGQLRYNGSDPSHPAFKRKTLTKLARTPTATRSTNLTQAKG